MSEKVPNAVLETDSVAVQDPNPNISLETLVLLINTERLKFLQEQTAKEFKELRDRQEKVRSLQSVLQAINNKTNDSGELDLKNETELLNQIKDLKKHEIPVQEDKTKYSGPERDRLVDNVKMAIEDLNVQNDMQLQKISRFTNERYEAYQMARSILKPLHDDKQNKARAIAGH